MLQIFLRNIKIIQNIFMKIGIKLVTTLDLYNMSFCQADESNNHK